MPSFSIGIIKRKNCFSQFELCFETQAGYLFSFYKTLFTNFFQSSFSDGKLISSELYLFIKGLIFVVLSGFFLFLHDLTRLLQHIESIYYLFYWWDLLLLFCILANHENLYMIHHNLVLFYNIYSTISEHNWRPNYCLSLIPNYFDT